MRRKLFFLLSMMLAAIGSWAQAVSYELGTTSLEEQLSAAGVNEADVTSLTLTGSWTFADAWYIHSNFANLEVLDMSGMTMAASAGSETVEVAGGEGTRNFMCQNRVVPASFCKDKVKLTTVKLPNVGGKNPTVIEHSAFAGCTALTSIDLGGNGNFNSVGACAFNGCSSLETIDFSFMNTDNNSGFGRSAFAGCVSLKEVKFPTNGKGPKSIGSNCFNYCPALESIVLPNSVQTIDAAAFSNCPKLANITLPTNDNFKTISKYAFSLRNYSTEVKVNIPASVTEIGEQAFSAITTLSLDIYPATPPTCGANPFNGVKNVTATFSGDAATNKCAYRTADGWTDILADIISENCDDEGDDNGDENDVDYIVATVYEQGQVSRNYDSGNGYYGYQIYDRTLNIDASGHDVNNLALEFDVYVENLDNPGNIENLFTYQDKPATIEFLELGNDQYNNPRGLTWGIKDLIKQEGWNHAVVKLTDAPRFATSTFTVDDKIVWFRFCLAHVYAPDAYIIRIKNVNLVDLTGEKSEDGQGDDEIDTSFNVADIPYTLEQSIEFNTSDQGIVVGKAFDAVDISKHDIKQCYLQFDATLTLSGATIADLGTNGQIELTSSGRSDVNEATFTINSVDWQEGTHTYTLPLVSAGTSGGAIDWSAVNYMRLYWVHMLATSGSFYLKLDNVKIVDHSSLTSLPTLFSDGMMFQQKKPINIWGYATGDKTISVELFKGNSSLGTQTATLDNEGKWQVTFPAQNASYDKYHFVVSENGKEIQTVNDVLVGEVWVAGGQSNMALSVAVTIDAEEIKANANNDYIRIFMEPSMPTGNESPYTPMKDIAGAAWGHGNNPNHVNNVSAVAYSMVKELQQKLNIPVGFVNTAIGGSVIEAWIPREEIESDADLKDKLNRIGMYFDESFWVNGSTTITGFYNAKIGPLAGYNVAGAIWYQGESNSGRAELYASELNLLKKGWERTFGFAEGEMPFIFTQVAPWATNLTEPFFLSNLAEAMYDGWKLNENKKTGMIAIYDTDLQYGIKINNNADPIHPTNKTPIGQRFATAAYNLVYGSGEYTAPVFESLTASDDKLIVKFSHVGDGLKSKDGTGDVHGFAIAASDGLYAGAQARIISKDEVEVWNPGIKSPEQVTYAWATYNVASNLMNSADIPAAPFRSSREAGQTFYNPQDWTFCDSINVWAVDNGTTVYAKNVGSLPAWKTSTTGAEVSFTTDVKADGAASIVGTYPAGGGSFGPELRYQTTITQLKNFKALYVSVNNTDGREKTLQLIVNGAQVGEDVSVSAVSGFQTVGFDISELASEATMLEFKVVDSAAGTIYLDNVLFGTELDIPATRYVISDEADNASLLQELDGQTVDVTIERTFGAGKWNTICLPFDLEDPTAVFGSNVKVKKLDNDEMDETQNELTLNFVDVTSLEAGVPYVVMFEGNADVVNPEFDGVTISAETKDVKTSYCDMVGLYAPKSFAANDKTVLFLKSNSLYYPSTTDAMPALRAYFQLHDLTADYSRSFKLNLDGEATAIRLVGNGNVVESAEYYDLQGRKVTGQPRKGVYVVNGRKVIVK